jgi:hypothetical protein
LKAVSTATSSLRTLAAIGLQALLVFAIIATILFALSPMSKPASLLAGTGQAFAGKVSYSPTLDVKWPQAALSVNSTDPTPYSVVGCGYNSAYGGVTVVVHSPEAVSFSGGMPDPDTGCISVGTFYTQGSGHYDIDAYQTMRKKSTLVASTSFDL